MPSERLPRDAQNETLHTINLGSDFAWKWFEYCEEMVASGSKESNCHYFALDMRKILQWDRPHLRPIEDQQLPHELPLDTESNPISRDGHIVIYKPDGYIDRVTGNRVRQVHSAVIYGQYLFHVTGMGGYMAMSDDPERELQNWRNHFDRTYSGQPAELRASLPYVHNDTLAA